MKKFNSVVVISGSALPHLTPFPHLSPCINALLESMPDHVFDEDKFVVGSKFPKSLTAETDSAVEI